MSALREVEFDAMPGEAEVLRLLGFREGVTRIEEPMRRVLDEARTAARGRVRARVATRIEENPSRFGKDGVFGRADALVLGVATIGGELETLTEELVEKKSLTLALVLDAYGSAAVEAAVVQANYRVCEEAEADGRVAGRRLSPGYPRWPIEQQRLVFDALGRAPAGVLLNEYCVMSPRKSVSFGIPVGTELDAGDPELGCRYCAMTHCAYRRQPADLT
jgi:hypothetical protein